MNGQIDEHELTGNKYVLERVMRILVHILLLIYILASILTRLVLIINQELDQL